MTRRAPARVEIPITDCPHCLQAQRDGNLPQDHEHCLDTFACAGAKLNAAGGELARVAAVELKRMRDNVCAFVRYLYWNRPR